MKKLPLIVQKYGGSSLARPEQIKAAAERIADLHRRGHALLVVVSAMGKTTDQLVDLAYLISTTPNRRELDMLLTTGERISMSLMSMALNDAGCSAISFTGSQAGVLTDDSHSNARIIDVKPTRVEAELSKNRVPVLAGFQGVSPRSKEITTLGRGGSDTTAVALAAYFKAQRCEIRKDVDGVYSADPNAVAGATHIPTLHYLQLLDMTYWGAKVLHYRSAELASLLNIPVVIALAHGEGRQTLINGESPMYEQANILSVNSHKDVRWLIINKSELSGALQEMHAFLHENNLPWPQLLDSERRSGAHPGMPHDRWALLVTGPLETLNALGNLLKNHTRIAMDADEFSSITATCQGSYASALPEEITKILSMRDISVHKMLFSAMSVTVLLDAKDRDQAMRAIHELRSEMTVTL